MEIHLRFGLTRREAEVLPFVADGLSNSEIGAALFITSATVRSHMTNLMEKLDARNRTHLVAIAFREGLLK